MQKLQNINNKGGSRMKRLLTLVIALVMMLPVLSSRSIAADAGEQRDVKELYLISDKVNDDHIAYANSEKENVLMALKDVVSLDGFVLEDMISFGKPFNLNESTYIPIIIGNKIVALMAVSDFEGELGWTLSKDFSDGLNQISKLTSLESPASLYTVKGNVFAIISGKEIQLTFYPELEVSEDSKLYNDAEIPSKNVVNVMEIENLEGSYRLYNMVFASRSSSSKYIDLDLAETQEDQSWCSAFAGAQILRQRGKGKIYANNIMRYFYPNVSYDDLKKKSISHNQLIKYANNKKSYPSKSTGTLSLDSVKKQIDSKKSIYLSCDGTGTYKKANHALVLRGYNTRNNTYSVWNPWNDSYVSMSISSKSISVNGGKFIWSSTIYGW